MSEEKKICPFLTKLYDPKHDDITGVYCSQEKCMAWGMIQLVRGSNDNTFWGCKLIDKPE